MYYCEECRKEKEWPVSDAKYYGQCVVCGAVGDCYDVHISKLPLPKSEGDILAALKVIGQLQEQGFETITDGKAGTILQRGNVQVIVHNIKDSVLYAGRLVDAKTGKQI